MPNFLFLIWWIEEENEDPASTSSSETIAYFQFDRSPPPKVLFYVFRKYLEEGVLQRCSVQCDLLVGNVINIGCTFYASFLF